MGLSTPVLYELIFLAAVAVMALTSALVLVTLRLLLRSWHSVLSKTLVLHMVNMAAVLATIQLAMDHFPLLAFSGLLNGSSILFCMFLALADGTRAWRRREMKDGAAYGLGPWTAFLLIVTLGVGLVRATAAAPGAREALERTSWSFAANRSLNSNPFWQEAAPAMQKAFPQQLTAIYLRYVAQARKENSGKPWRQVILPAVPVGDFTGFITSQQRNIAFAPDAELLRAAKVMPDLLGGLSLIRGDCSAAGRARHAFTIKDADAPADRGMQRLEGKGVAAQILAARAGIDHPVRREISAARALALETQFHGSLTPQLRQLYDQNQTGPSRCEIVAARAQWIAGLPAEEAIFVLSIPQNEMVARAR